MVFAIWLTNESNSNGLISQNDMNVKEGICYFTNKWPKVIV